MTTWWSNLSKRERYLVTAMVALFAIVLVFLLVIRPINGFRQSAALNLASAQTTSQLVSEAVATGVSAAGQVQNVDTLRALVTRSAQGAGLRWINIRTNQQDVSLTISFGDVSAGALYGWLIDLQERSNVVVRDARISETRNGTGVEASITFIQGV